MDVALSILEVALSAHAVGICVLPPKEDGSKAPLGAWAQYQTISSSDSEIRAWYANGHGRQGIGFVTGSVSGDLELFEFENREVYTEYYNAAQTVGLGELLQRIERGYFERTPGGGIHLFYRCHPCAKNTKLARDASGKVSIETRGEGGYAVVAPSAGRVHPSGRAYERLAGEPASIVTISESERQQLWELARCFDAKGEDWAGPQEDKSQRQLSADPRSPGNDYRNRTTWPEVLEPHGWKAVYTKNDVTYWRRPGKREGISGSTNYHESDLFYPWSTSTEFEADRGYNRFSVYTILEHGGDFSAAARALGASGYGASLPQIKKRATPIGDAGETPALPAEFSIPLRNDWLLTYLDYARCVSPMTPDHFHVSAALWLASTVIARRLCVKMPYGYVYPNLWILWLAPTTLYRKSTAMNVARTIAKREFPHLLCPQEMSQEALLTEFAGYEPHNIEKLSEDQKARWRKGRDYAAQKGLALDEASGLLAGAGRDYNAGLIESFMRFYDCEDDYSRTTRSQGLVMIKNSYLSVLGASTAAAMASHLTQPRLWSMGFWPRFGIVTPGNARPQWSKPRHANEPKGLQSTLRSIQSRLPEAHWPASPSSLVAGISDDAIALWEIYNQQMSYELLIGDDIDDRLRGLYGRLPTHAVKVALILATLEWPTDYDRPAIEIQHLREAVGIVENWRLGAHDALELAVETEQDRWQRQVLNAIAKSGAQGTTARDIRHLIRGIHPDALLQIIEQLVRVGEIEEFTPKSTTGGRPTKRYKTVTE